MTPATAAATRIPVVIGIAGGLQMPLGHYIATVRHAIRNPGARFHRSFCGWWPATGHEIRQQFGRGVHDRINRHQDDRDDRKGPTARLLKRMRAGKITRSCKWCGSPVPHPTSVNDWFCDASCLRAYRGLL